MRCSSVFDAVESGCGVSPDGRLAAQKDSSRWNTLNLLPVRKTEKTCTRTPIFLLNRARRLGASHIGCATAPARFRMPMPARLQVPARARRAASPPARRAANSPAHGDPQARPKSLADSHAHRPAHRSARARANQQGGGQRLLGVLLSGELHFWEGNRGNLEAHEVKKPQSNQSEHKPDIPALHEKRAQAHD